MTDIEPSLSEQSRLSAFFPNDPPYLKQRWAKFVDCIRQDMLSATNKRDITYSRETNLALDAYWDAVVAAKEAGYPPFAQLNERSKRVKLFGPKKE